MRYGFIRQAILMVRIFFCDNCVPRGCSCNVYSLEEFPLEKKKEKNYIFWDEKIENYTTELSDKSHYYEVVDENNRRYPCCEYEYDENGFDHTIL